MRKYIDLTSTWPKKIIYSCKYRRRYRSSSITVFRHAAASKMLLHLPLLHRDSFHCGWTWTSHSRRIYWMRGFPAGRDSETSPRLGQMRSSFSRMNYAAVTSEKRKSTAASEGEGLRPPSPTRATQALTGRTPLPGGGRFRSGIDTATAIIPRWRVAKWS